MKWAWDGVTSCTEGKMWMLGKRCHGNFCHRKIVDSSKMFASRLKWKMWRKTFRKIVFTSKYQIVLNFEFSHLVVIQFSVRAKVIEDAIFKGFYSPLKMNSRPTIFIWNQFILVLQSHQMYTSRHDSSTAFGAFHIQPRPMNYFTLDYLDKNF